VIEYITEAGIAYKGHFMEAKYYLLCPLCSYETEHITLARTYRHISLQRKWMVCLECHQLQEKPHPKRFLIQALKVLWLNAKHFISKGRKHNPSKLLQKPSCYKCHGSHLLEWDGNCPKCGSAFLKKVV
jgi:hypothetical protein